MDTVQTLIDAVGRDALAARLNVTQSAVSNALARGKMPASWYRTVKEMTDAAGAECPLVLFNWKSPVAAPGASCLPAQRGHAETVCQPSIDEGGA